MKNSIYYDWQYYFKDIGIRDDLAEVYLVYVDDCLDKNIPPIFEIEHLALLVGRSADTLMSMIEGSSSFYRLFKIRKRSGGHRTISAPYPSLLEVQRWINDTILVQVLLPNHVTGFRRGYSIVDNAKMHCGREELIKLDIENFFPSIEFRRIMFVFMRLGYPQNVSYYLSKLCTLDDRLPQGASTSPALSNIVCKNMDRQFYNICKKYRLRYTRYADDISISDQHIPKGIKRLFFEIIENENFKVNEKKVRFLSGRDRKIVTGLDITSGVPRVTRKFRREIQKDVYFVWSAGLSTHVARRKIFAPNYIDQIEGRVQFWASVEPENPQLIKTRGRLIQLKKVYGTKSNPNSER